MIITKDILDERAREYRASLPTLRERLYRGVMDMIYRRKYVEVGDILVNPIWGKSRTEIIVVAVSHDKTQFTYNFLRANGRLTTSTKISVPIGEFEHGTAFIEEDFTFSHNHIRASDYVREHLKPWVKWIIKKYELTGRKYAYHELNCKGLNLFTEVYNAKFGHHNITKIVCRMDREMNCEIDITNDGRNLPKFTYTREEITNG